MSKLYEALKKAEAEKSRKEEEQDCQERRSSLALHIKSFFQKDGSGESRLSASEGKGGFVPQDAKPLQNNEGGEGEREVSIITRGMTVRGHIHVEENLNVQGYVEGSISLTGDVVIEAGAEIQAEVSAGRIIVGGSIKGNLTASEKVEVLSTGKVHGNILAKMLLVHEGASITGGLHTGAPPKSMVGELKEALTEFQQLTSRLRAIINPVPPKETA
ncbi:MAG: polymer-forming cytoskeletal protein [Candidatus Binatia bacterium]